METQIRWIRILYNGNSEPSNMAWKKFQHSFCHDLPSAKIPVNILEDPFVQRTSLCPLLPCVQSTATPADNILLVLAAGFSSLHQQDQQWSVSLSAPMFQPVLWESAGSHVLHHSSVVAMHANWHYTSGACTLTTVIDLQYVVLGSTC
jgi:hypothetical protein